jgi:hypothetical protein
MRATDSLLHFSASFSATKLPGHFAAIAARESICWILAGAGRLYHTGDVTEPRPWAPGPVEALCQSTTHCRFAPDSAARPGKVKIRQRS